MDLRPLKRLVSLVAVLLLLVPSALAVYSIQGTFDTSRLVTLSGGITQVEWSNPITYLRATLKDSDGNSVPWVIRLSPASVLVSQGFVRDSFTKGRNIVVEVWPTKAGDDGRPIVDPAKGERLGAAWKLTFDDGRVLQEASKSYAPWLEPAIFPSQR